MKIFKRVLRRSGELVFDPVIDGIAPPQDDRRLAWLAAWMPAGLRGLRVADVGCWTGGLLAWAVDQGAADVTGIDLPGPWLDTTRARVPAARICPTPSLSELPASLNGLFDLVFFLETLEHLPRRSELQALTSLRRLLAPGGRLVLSTPVAGLMAVLDPAWFAVGHRHYSSGALRNLLCGAGLAVREVRWSGNVWEALSINLLYIEKHIMRRPPQPHHWLQRRTDRGLRHRPMLTSTTIWMCCDAGM